MELIRSWAIVLALAFGFLAAMAFLAGWDLVGIALGLVTLVLVGWVGGELR